MESQICGKVLSYNRAFVCHLLFSNTPYPKRAAIASPKAESYQKVKSFIIERAYSLLPSFCSYISSPSDVGRVVQMLGAEKFLFFVYCDAETVCRKTLK